MTEYDKLTVVKLREELVKRGLPKTGLKAALVQRLVEADAQAAQPTPDSEQTEQAPPEVQSEAKRSSAASEALPVPPEQSQLDKNVDDVARPEPPAEVAAQVDETPEPSAQLPNGVSFNELPTETEVVAPDTPAEAGDSSVQEQQTSDIKLDTIQQTETKDEIPVKVTEEVVEAPRPEEVATVTDAVAEDQASQTVFPPTSTQTSALAGEDLREDTNKRKRRSQSPPPSSIDNARKRTKASDGRPQVKLPEDEESRSAPPSQQTQEQGDTGMVDAPTEAVTEEPIEDADANGDVRMHADVGASPVVAKKGNDHEVPNSVSSLDGHIDKDDKPATQVDQQDNPPPSNAVETPPKQSPSDTRFKNLFTGPPKREGSPPRQRPRSGDDDRVISPALHPATAALYIRDFMRPINPVHLKDYLSALASPAYTDPDPGIITEFFLDNVKTHCLVGFSNTSAAARVRLGMHDRVWPDEATRKPLWVDFVPEEKLAKWIEVETGAAGDRRQGMKKWEVVYEEGEGGVTAYLQEAGPNSSAPRSVQPMLPRKESVSATYGAPSGPKSRNEGTRTSQPGPTAKSDGGKGFQALDELFKATAAKPKLYYLPVSQDIVDRRLDRLAAGRGGGMSDEKRRYTFEEGSLVDKGPEFGFRRGGYGGRGGGGYGGYHGRGGGYRGDNWRGRR